jgi:hypothetical protein
MANKEHSANKAHHLMRSSRKSGTQNPNPLSRPVDRLVPVMMRILEITAETELSCDEVLELIDQYADLKSQGRDMENLDPMIRQHLELCRDCLEEYEGLLRVLAIT